MRTEIDDLKHPIEIDLDLEDALLLLGLISRSVKGGQAEYRYSMRMKSIELKFKTAIHQVKYQNVKQNQSSENAGKGEKHEVHL